MTDEVDYLDIRRDELVERYKQTYGPKVEAAKRRREAMGRVTREVAVHALSTVIGGAVLAGGAVAVGWLGSDPALRASVGAGAIVLVLLLIMSVRTASRPLYTSRDVALSNQIEQLDALIAERDKRRAEETPDG